MPCTVGQYICSHLKANGVDHIFGVAGDFVLSFFEIVEKDDELTLVCCTNELNAAYAADGYSRANQYSSIALTFGVGELSAANGIGGAHAESIPMLLIVGRPPSDDERIHHQASPTSVLSSCKAMEQICAQSLILSHHNLSELPSFLSKAPLAAGPSYLSVSCALFDCPLAPEVPRPLVPERVTPEYTTAARRLNDLIRGGTRPLIIIGQELNIVSRSEVGRCITSWLCAFKNAVVTHALGSAGLTHSEGWRSIGDHIPEMSHYSPIVHLGWTHHDLSSGFGSIPVGEHEVSSHRITICDIKPSLGAALRIIESAIALAGEEGAYTATTSTFALPDEGYLDDVEIASDKPLSVKGLCRILAAVIKPGDKIVRDTGRVTFDLGTIDLPPNVPIFHQEMYASIGWSGGAVLGVHLSQCPWDSGRTISVIGDGAFQMTHNEIANMVRCTFKYPLIYMVANNDGYLVERTIKDNSYNDIPRIDYAGLARALGVEHAVKVESEGELIAELKKCSTPGVHFLELVLPKFDMIDPVKGWKMGETIWARNAYQG